MKKIFILLSVCLCFDQLSAAAGAAGMDEGALDAQKALFRNFELAMEGDSGLGAGGINLSSAESGLAALELEILVEKDVEEFFDREQQKKDDKQKSILKRKLEREVEKSKEEQRSEESRARAIEKLVLGNADLSFGALNSYLVELEALLRRSKTQVNIRPLISFVKSKIEISREDIRLKGMVQAIKEKNKLEGKPDSYLTKEQKLTIQSLTQNIRARREKLYKENEKLYEENKDSAYDQGQKQDKRVTFSDRVQEQVVSTDDDAHAYRSNLQVSPEEFYGVDPVRFRSKTRDPLTGDLVLHFRTYGGYKE